MAHTVQHLTPDGSTLGNCYKLEINGRTVGYFSRQETAEFYVQAAEQYRGSVFDEVLISKHYLEGF